MSSVSRSQSQNQEYSPEIRFRARRRQCLDEATARLRSDEDRVSLSRELFEARETIARQAFEAGEATRSSGVTGLLNRIGDWVTGYDDIRAARFEAGAASRAAAHAQSVEEGRIEADRQNSRRLFSCLSQARLDAGMERQDPHDRGILRMQSGIDVMILRDNLDR